MLELRLQNRRLSKQLGVLNEDGVNLFWTRDPNKESKYLQQAEYSDKKDEINTDKYDN
jgi:hypothetical protein